MTIYNIIIDKQPYSNPSKEKRQYTIKIEELRRKGTVSDILSIESGKAVVTRKIGYYQGETYLLEEPIIEEIKDIDIYLFEGTNYIYVQNENNMILSAEYVIKNEFTDTFPTKIEMTSSINQRANEIILNVNQKFTNYDTSEEVNSKISQKASEINLEVSKKVGEDEIISKINQSPETVGINANKIELSANDVLNLLAGNTINLSGKNIKIASNNFNVDENGNMSCSNVNITNGKVILGSPLSSEGNSVFKIYSGDNGPYIEIYPDTLVMQQDSPYSRIFFGLQDGDISFQLMDKDESETKGYPGAVNYWGPGGSGGTYVGYDKITTPSITQTSLEESKKNFEKLNNGLDIIKNTDIYRYNLKSQKDGDKKHIGFVIGKDYKYSKEITALDNKGKEVGVDTYSMISVAYKAIQEQQELIEQLQKEIKEMKGA